MVAREVRCTAAMSSPAALHQVLAVRLEAANTAVLHRVLGLLLEATAPARQTTVLRAAIAQLVAEDAVIERPAAAQRQPAPSRRAKRAAAQVSFCQSKR
jgi:hypothetical protein